MIREFALDPNVLSSWDSFRYFIDKFGVSQGRMISQFPKTWKRMVYEASANCREIDRARIENKLASIDDKLLRRGYVYNGNLSWLANAESNHDLFHAIITSSNPNGIANILISGDLDETNFRWKTNRENVIPRIASVMADCAAPIIGLSREILFVDPHFNPSKLRYRNSLKAFLVKIGQQQKIIRIEYHLKDNLPAHHFENECKQKLPHIIPTGLQVKFVRWKEQDGGGESLHPRYLLTDIGGIRFEHGLDEEPKGATVDVSLLDNAVYKKRWQDYQKQTSPFVFVDEFIISGNG